MRILPASAYKNGARPPRTEDGKPRPGSNARLLYDLFQANRATPIKNVDCMKFASGGRSRVIDDLKDYWGLDIRSVPNCHYKCLVGEWFGDKYVDYVAEKIK